MGRIPSAVGYQPTLVTEMSALQERITSTKKDPLPQGCVCSPQMTIMGSSPSSTFVAFGCICQLGSFIREQALYPAVDPLTSSSMRLIQISLDKRHEVSQQVLKILQRYKDFTRYYVLFLVIEESSDEDKKTVARAVRFKDSDTTILVAEQFTNSPGKYVPIKDTVRGFKGNIDRGT